MLSTTATTKSIIQASQSWKIFLPIGVSANLIPWIFWNLWIARNWLIFENRDSTPAKILWSAILSAREWEQAQPLVAHHTTIRGETLSPPAPESTILCYTDGAWRADQQQAGLGWVFTDDIGSTISTGTRFQTHVSSASMAEAIAVREALIHASTLGFTKIWLRSDAQELVIAINAQGKSIELQGVLSDISLLSASFSFSHFSYVSRSLNGLADSIAKACLCTHQNFLGL